MVAAWWLLAEAADVERHDDGRLRRFHSGVADMHLYAVLSTRLADDEADAVVTSGHFGCPDGHGPCSDRPHDLHADDHEARA